MQIKKDSRLQERFVVSFPANLTGYDTSDEKWESKATIFNLSKNGAGVVVNKKSHLGRLIFLTAPIPHHLRADERTEEEYSVWGIVQHCAPFQGDGAGENYYLGIGFIGENPPQSYLENPLQDYRLTGVQKNGFWRLAETAKEFKPRKHPRFSISVEVYLGTLDEHNNLATGEKVKTDNVSIGGAAVLSDLDIKIGDCVKLIASEWEFSALAIVRNVHLNENRKTMVRLEFIAGKLPVQEIKELKTLNVV